MSFGHARCEDEQLLQAEMSRMIALEAVRDDVGCFCASSSPDFGVIHCSILVCVWIHYARYLPDD